MAANTNNTPSTTTPTPLTKTTKVHHFHPSTPYPIAPDPGILGIEELGPSGWLYTEKGKVTPNTTRDPIILPRVVWVKPDPEVRDHFLSSSWQGEQPWTAMTSWKIASHCQRVGEAPTVGDHVEGLWVQTPKGYVLHGMGTVEAVWDDVTLFWKERPE
ncbi:hypothetical protein BJX70DRAFT_404046 [Aspergillus crustosus]